MATSPELDAELDVIRCHMGSSVPSQKARAVLLNALESTFNQQATVATPVAYFAALSTTLDQAIKRDPNLSTNTLSDGAILPAALHLLAIVVPNVPPPVIRSQLTNLLNLLTPLFPSISNYAPPLCSQIAIFAALFPILDSAQFSTPQLRQSFVAILELSLDPRQKVRRKAQEALSGILAHPPSPLIKHPYVEKTADYVLGVLKAVEDRSISKKIDGAVDTGVWCCGLLKSISDVWPEEQLSPLITLLLGLPKLSSPLLTAQAFNVLTALLKTPQFTPASATLPIVLQSLIESPPPAAANGLPEAWLDVVENAMVAYARSDPTACSNVLETIWARTWEWLKASSVSVRIAAEKALGAMVRYCVTGEAIDETVQAVLMGDEDSETTLSGMLSLLENSFDSLPFSQAMPHLLYVLSRFVSRLRHRTNVASSHDARAMTAAEILLADHIKYVGDLRISEHFEYKERADDVLGTAIQVLGPEAFLDILPLNLLPSDQQVTGDTGRAFLLPIFARNITNTSLKHFRDYFVPLSEQLFELRNNAEAEKRMVEAKIWEACVEQVWSCFKGYCEVTIDIPEAFTPEFAQLLSNLLYSQPGLRPPIFSGLLNLIQTTKALALSSTPAEQMTSTFGISPERAAQSLTLLKRLAGDMLSVLFNVYSGMPVDSRNMVADVITAWLGIAERQEILVTYNKVMTLLQQNLPTTPTTASLSHAHTMLDLLNMIIPLLDATTAQSFYAIVLDPDTNMLDNSDSSTQKKTYRALAAVVAHPTGVVCRVPSEVEAMLQRLEGNTAKVLPGAKPDRMRLLKGLLSNLPSTLLHHISLLLPEITMGTKEFNEKTRIEAFECLVIMGQKIKTGGAASSSAMDMDEAKDASTPPADIEAYLKLAAAGLVGASPHMISASITAVARILFEFKDSVSEPMQTEITSTMVVFLSTSNREVVKAALGYFKVAIVALQPVVRLQLDTVVPALLGWTHDKKNPFKAPVLRLLSSMIKRYGFDPIWEAGSKSDNTQVLSYVRKRAEKARKKKAIQAKKEEEDADSDAPEPKLTTGNAFEDVLYGSDSDESDDERPETAAQNVRPAKTKSKLREPRLRVDDDHPLDLVHGSVANITTAPIVKRRKPGQDAAHFKVDEETGRFVFGDEGAVDVLAAPAAEPDNVAGQAYMDQMVTVDGYTRTATGAVKFHKNTKKRRAMELEEAGDVDMADNAATPADKKSRKRQPIKIGKEFKAKKAGGDVKRQGQQDPFAYLTLREVAGKKKGVPAKYSITGKK